MLSRFYKTLPFTFLVLFIGIVSIAATDTYTRTHADANITTRARPMRHVSLLPFYINESVKTISFTDSSTINKTSTQVPLKDIFTKEWSKLSSQIPRDKVNTLDKPVRDAVHALKQTLWDLRSDCIVGTLTSKKSKDLENFYVLVQSGLTTLQNDCGRALSMYSTPVDRLRLESYAHNAYKNFSTSANDEYNLMSLDELEKSYLTFLYLAITEPFDKAKQDYYFIVGFIGLKLWSFNKDDAAALPLLALSAEDITSDEGMSAWLLLKDHIQFANSGSAGEHVPLYWNVILYKVGKK